MSNFPLADALKSVGTSILAVKILSVEYLTEPATYLYTGQYNEYWISPDKKKVYCLPK